MHQAINAADLRPFSWADRLLVVHCEGGWKEPVIDDQFDVFTRLAALLEEKNVASVAVTLDSALSTALLAQDHLHIIVGDRPMYRANTLHIVPTYLWGFWYLDEIGVHWNSSIRLKQFAANDIDPGHAEYFFNGVAGHMVRENVSKISQPERVDYLEEAAVVVFCQDTEHRYPDSHYLSTDDIIRNAARAARGAKVYVKMHPAQSDATREKIEKTAGVDPNILLSNASVHDLIGASRVVVTQNSAAGFEALLHRKPVVTCAKSDYHHATLVARTDEELRDMIRNAPDQMADFPYDKYVYWFLSKNCIEPQKAGFAEHVWAKIAEKALIS